MYLQHAYGRVIMTTEQAVIFIVMSLALVRISLNDIRDRIITHRSLLCLLFLVVSYLFMGSQPPNIIAGALFLVVGFVIFSLGVTGGGDVKLISILALAVPDGKVFPFILLTAWMGGGVAITGLLFFARDVRKRGVPYGVGIALSFILLQFSQLI